jgi:hypothetical protein
MRSNVIPCAIADPSGDKSGTYPTRFMRIGIVESPPTISGGMNNFHVLLLNERDKEKWNPHTRTEKAKAHFLV